MRRIPTGLTFESAATLPVAFMTAWHALRNGAFRRESASSFMPAPVASEWLQSRSRPLGAEVIASAGSPSKRALLETPG